MNFFWKASHKLFNIKIFRPLARFLEIQQQIIYCNAISSKCEIGKNTVFLHHGMGCTVHYNAKIGDNCRIFTNVVIGDKWSDCIRTGKAPTIGNNCMIGAGAVILGEITIGDYCIIGANSVITKSVPAGYHVVGANKIIRNNDFKSNS